VPLIVNRQGTIQSGDTLLFFDYRSDRMRQIVETFGIRRNFETPTRHPENLKIYQMTQYNSSFSFPILFPPQCMDNVLSEWLSKFGLWQFHTAETEKYAHVTFFSNGGREAPFPREERKLVDSPKVATYDLSPPMSMESVGASVVAAMACKSPEFSFVMCNLAAPDMVGHTGHYQPTVQACEACDRVIGTIWEGCRRHGYTLVVTSDHGNAEEMLEPPTADGIERPKTSHTTNLVPFILASDSPQLGVRVQRMEGGLRDVAPSILHVMGLPKPPEMTGESLLVDA